jgi:hypothetical protein
VKTVASILDVARSNVIEGGMVLGRDAVLKSAPAISN